MNKAEKRKFFTEKLIQWDKKLNRRHMPWKGEKDPYKIWLSEVILQQTRVEQGLAYYERFVKKYPTVGKLAAAEEDKVFKLWEGLGYYSRCRNLLFSARYIAFEQKGEFPVSYEAILSLKGVGPYTAAAIASFAYGLPYAVVDGNVTRVLARFFGIGTAVDSTEGKKFFAELAQSLLHRTDPALYNQAIMDFGAVICKPQLPLCPQCPLQKECTALKKNMVAALPAKEKKLIRKKRCFFYIIAEYGDRIYVRKRIEKDIWQNLWEFISTEVPLKTTAEEFLSSPGFISVAGRNKALHISGVFTQKLTHRDIEAIFIHVKLRKPLQLAGYIAMSKKELGALAFPRIVNEFLGSGQGVEPCSQRFCIFKNESFRPSDLSSGGIKR